MNSEFVYTPPMNDNNQWKIASSSNSRNNSYVNHGIREQNHTPLYSLGPQHASLSPSLGRSQSPLSKIERYKPKTPMIDKSHQIRKAPPRLEEKEQLEEIKERSKMPLPIEPITDDVAIVTEKPAVVSTSKRKATINPVLTNTNLQKHTLNDHGPWTWWSTYAFVLTCCIPNWLLSAVGKKKTKLIQQAWREKIALCSVIIFLCAGLGFFTFGMRFALCPHERVTNTYSFQNTTTGETSLTWRSDVTVYGRLYPIDIMNSFLQERYNISLSKDFEGADMSQLFDADPNNNLCSLYMTSSTTCIVMNPYTIEPTAAIQLPCIPLYELTDYYSADNYLEFTWDDLKFNLQRQYNAADNRTEIVFSNQPHLMVLSDTVIDIRPYISLNQSIFGDKIDLLLRQNAGQDATYTFSTWNDAKSVWPCLVTKYASGVISSDTMGCIAYEIVTDFLLAMVVTLMLARYLMALIFHWWVSRRLTKPGGRSRGLLAWRSIAGGNQFPKKHRPSTSSSVDTLVATPTFQKGQQSEAAFENDPRYTVLFVTCYSEGEESIKSTLDSLVETTYSDQHKLLFIVADGVITGSGNSRPTSEICRNLLILIDCEDDEEEPACEYEAIADGSRRVNRARVYIGHYRSIPALLVIKCGTEQEALSRNHKPGNRGKRDSQMILMSFFQKVIFYDLFTPLDYEIFWKMRKLMKAGLTPDIFELVLMADADTRVDPDSLTHMVAAMNNDITLMGLCGETKVANKGASWVTTIQVFEYFISHHYAKAFESVFGGVTCLPGCFSMYRIKAPKNGGWIPILANPDIIREFNITTVNTLHAKNLLLLGEDRFLSALMLRTFPRRQMIFVPQAKCRTIVPDSFHVLLSQRRRWINSTVHNLMELALVSDLCGIACLSMQFVVVMDLISSIVLPVAVILLVCFFINVGLTDSPQYEPLFILLATLGLPALLILLTAKKLSYIGWMAIYILALPIWNFVLPIYSFWHFDDFTWGETRKIHGIDTSTVDNEERRGTKLLDSLTIEKRLWHSWEQERLKMPSKRIEKTKRSIPIKSTLQPISDIQSTPSRHVPTSVSPIYPTRLSAQSMQQPMFYYPNHNQFNSGHGFYGHHPPNLMQSPINQFMTPLPFIPQQPPPPPTVNIPFYPQDHRYPENRYLRKFS